MSEWFVPQYANQRSSLNSSAFENESEQSSLNYFWKRDNSPYKPDRIHSTTLSTDILSAIAGASLESSSNKAKYLLVPQLRHKIKTRNKGEEGLLFFKYPVTSETMKTRLKQFFSFCCRIIRLIKLIYFMYFFIILLSICSYNSFHSQIQ